MKPDQTVILQVVIDRQNRHQRNRLRRHRRQQSDPVHWNRRGQQKIFGDVQRLPQPCSLNLPDCPCDSQCDGPGQKQRRDTVYSGPQNRRHAGHCARVVRDESYERIVERKHQQPTVKRIVERCEVVILLLVKHHEAVVLLNQMVVSPQRRDKKESEAKTK